MSGGSGEHLMSEVTNINEKNVKKTEDELIKEDIAKEEFSFEELIKKNKEKQEKLSQSRIKLNQNVTRSYGLKRGKKK